MRRRRHSRHRRSHRYGRDASRKKFPKGLKRYQDFVDDQIRAGKTREQATKLWHKLKKNKQGAVKAAVRRRKKTTSSTSKRKKGTKMAAKRTLPPEIQALARALKEAGAKPQGPAKATKIERQLEGALRAMRKAQKNADSAARRQREDNEITDKARSILGGSGLYDGDPSRRKKGRGLKNYLAAGGSTAKWKRMSKKSRAKWARKSKKHKTKGKRSAHRDPGRHHRARRVRASRHARRRRHHGRRHGRRHPR